MEGFTEMSAEELRERIATAKLRLMLKTPWLGVLAMGLKMRPNRELPPEKPMAVDGVNIYFHPYFIQINDIPTIATVIAHETVHCAFLHIYRADELKKRYPGISDEILNIAADYAANWIVKDAGYDLLAGSLYHEDFHGMSFEEILHELLQMCGKDPKSSSNIEMPSMNNTPKNAGGGGVQSEYAPEDYKIDTQRYTQGIAPGDALRKLREGTLIPPGDMLEPAKDKKSRTVNDMKAKWMGRVRTALQRGTLPAGVQLIIKNLFETATPWKNILRDYVTKIMEKEYSWTTLNKKLIHRGIRMPGKARKKGLKIAVGIDSSGSTVPTIHEIVSELYTIVLNYPDSEIHVFVCDARVHEYFVMDGLPTLNEWHDIIENKIKGGGGTSTIPVFKEIEEKNLERDIKLLVYITDGFADYPETPPTYPVIWAITDEKGMKFPPFGDKILVKGGGKNKP